MAYPHERQIEYWTSREIENYFDNLHHSVVVIPNSQRLEKHIPFDHLFANSTLIKAFGFQYKRLYDKPDHWRLEQHQHWTMCRYPWIYYALSEVKQIHEHRNALHLLRIATPSRLHIFTPTQNTLRLDATLPYAQLQFARWGGFVQGLHSCNFGERIDDIAQLREVTSLAQDLQGALVDLFIVATGGRQPILIRHTPFVADIQQRVDEDDTGQLFDLGLDLE